MGLLLPRSGLDDAFILSFKVVLSLTFMSKNLPTELDICENA